MSEKEENDSDITLPPDSYSDFSSTPNEKYEEPWTDSIEFLLTDWKEDLDKLSELHEYAGYIVKSRYYRLAIPGIAIPLVMGFISQTLPEGQPAIISNGVVFMVSGILSGLQTLFNYGQLYEEHFQYSSRFSDIVKRIDSELARKRKFRTPADVFLTEVKCKIEYLTEGSPEMPMNFTCCNS